MTLGMKTFLWGKNVIGKLIEKRNAERRCMKRNEVKNAGLVHSIITCRCGDYDRGALKFTLNSCFLMTVLFRPNHAGYDLIVLLTLPARLHDFNANANKSPEIVNHSMPVIKAHE
jgi:hypothetical protein